MPHTIAITITDEDAKRLAARAEFDSWERDEYLHLRILGLVHDALPANLNSQRKPS